MLTQFYSNKAYVCLFGSLLKLLLLLLFGTTKQQGKVSTTFLFFVFFYVFLFILSASKMNIMVKYIIFYFESHKDIIYINIYI